MAHIEYPVPTPAKTSAETHQSMRSYYLSAPGLSRAEAGAALNDRNLSGRDTRIGKGGKRYQYHSIESLIDEGEDEEAMEETMGASSRQSSWKLEAGVDRNYRTSLSSIENQNARNGIQNFFNILTSHDRVKSTSELRKLNLSMHPTLTYVRGASFSEDRLEVRRWNGKKEETAFVRMSLLKHAVSVVNPDSKDAAKLYIPRPEHAKDESAEKVVGNPDPEGELKYLAKILINTMHEGKRVQFLGRIKLRDMDLQQQKQEKVAAYRAGLKAKDVRAPIELKATG